MRAALIAAALASATVASSGCVTTAAVVRPHKLSLPVLIGATVADLAVVSILSSQLKDFSVGAVIATTIAATGADVGVACVFDGCRVLGL